MAGLSITGQMKVSTLQEKFLNEFGLTLRIYDGRSFADPTQTLAQVRKKKGSGKALSVAKNMKVGNLEDKFEEEFGLKVQIAGADDSGLCDNDLTLNAAQQEDEKKRGRKAKKAARGDKDSVLEKKVMSDLYKNLYPASEGYIDSEGDFCATLKLDISNFGDDTLSVYAEGNVRSEIAGEVDETSVYGQADVSEGCLEIRGGYVRVEEGIDPSFLVEADLEIVRFRKSDVLDITVPNSNRQVDVSYSSKGVKISEVACDWDEDDGSCRISVITEGNPPYGVLFALVEKGQEVYPTHAIVSEGRGEFEEILFEASPGSKAEITIGIGEPIDLDGKLSLEGKAKVEERCVPEELEEDDNFFDDDLSLSPFVFCINSEDIFVTMEESGEKAARDLLLTQLGTLMDALIDEVNDDTRFFVSDGNKKPVEVKTNDDLEKILGLSSAINMGSWLETFDAVNGYIQITAILHGTDHWDDGFLRVSGCDGIPNFNVWGMYSPLGNVAVQGYFSGEFDTGIANGPTEDSDYTAKKVMKFYGVSEKQFNIDIYGIEEN